SRYGWRTDPRVPNKMVESRNNARLVGPVKSVREYFQDSTITAFSQAWRFSPEGLRIGYRQWDAGAGMVWADTLTEVSWHANGGLNHAISRNAFLDVGVDPSDLSAKGEFRWDEHGHITALRYSMDKDFATYTSQYNAQGQLENWQGGTQLRTITYQNALPVSMVYTVSEAEYRTTYTYDDRGRTAKIREELPNGSVQITEIVYDDAAGRRLEAFSKYQDASLESMVEVEKVLYNEHGHPIEHIHTATGDPALSWFRRYTYTYDAQNNWTQRTTTDAWDKSDTYGETLEVLSRVLTYH
ncbi:MAG TPA: hypothetical protein DCR93_27055, partial [Cytophagales bacterium]|nr:hypothetical protein [Cytophagales bacterium]